MRWLARRKAASDAVSPDVADIYPIRTAMDLTIQVLMRRSRGYRRLMISVVLLPLLIVGVCVGLGSVRPLSALLFLVPLCAAYFYWDGRILIRWRAALLASWSANQIDLGVLRQGLSMNTALPQPTVAGMLSTLPAPPEAAERTLTIPTRIAIERTTLTVHACRSDTLLLYCLAYVLIASAVVVAVMLSRWQPLLLCAGVALLALTRFTTLWLRMQALDKTLTAVRNQPDFHASSYAQLAAELDWSSIPTYFKERLLSV